MKHRGNWLPYYWHLRHVPARGTALKAINALEPRKDLHHLPVVDVGAGHGPDALAFLKAGWNVTAVEESFTGLLITRLRALMAGKSRKLNCIQSSFRDFSPPVCACLNASFALPFCADEDWAAVWQKLINALPEGGIFAGQFFGREDTWAEKPLKNAPSLHFTKDQALAHFNAFEVLSLKEVNEAGAGPHGERKRWHAYHIVAVKK